MDLKVDNIVQFDFLVPVQDLEGFGHSGSIDDAGREDEIGRCKKESRR